MRASPAGGCASRRPVTGTASRRGSRGTARSRSPRSLRRWTSLRRGDPDGERAVIRGDIDRVRAGDPEAETLHVAPGLDVPELARVVERAEHAVLWTDHRDVER